MGWGGVGCKEEHIKAAAERNAVAKAGRETKVEAPVFRMVVDRGAEQNIVGVSSLANLKRVA